MRLTLQALRGNANRPPPIIVVFLLASCIASTCHPVLTALDPSSGPPGTVVEAIGSTLNIAEVRWDANTPSEQTVPGGFRPADFPTPPAIFFTVPLVAGAGDHSVRLFVFNSGYSDNTEAFTVTPGTVRPQPRLDDVTVASFSIDGDGKAVMILMAHGANFDVGAQIRVNGIPKSTRFWRLLRNANMNAANPETLGYPIIHYATIWTELSNETPGGSVSVSVRNLDGATSNELVYTVAATMDQIDSDGDGLPDKWEIDGYDADGDGTIDVDLPALGASPLRKDLFVEVDWMAAAAPNGGVWAAVEDAFANAPILNSDGSQGITIHIDRGQPGGGGGGGTIIPYADAIRFDNVVPDPGTIYVNFYDIKADPNNFDPNRRNIYRYAVLGWDNGHLLGSSGQAEGIWANDFFVSLGSWGPDGGTVDIQTGTFMHELGHTLNLRHGGFEDANSKDNYNSLMHYGNDWIIWLGQNNKFSPSQFSGIDVDCNLLNVDGVYTYSQGMRSELNEKSLDENVGVCDNVARDWNDNGVLQNPVSVNLDDNASLTTIRDYADWANIELNFRAVGSNWRGN